jgi:O-antigen ligase
MAALLLACLLFFGVMTLWVPERWAWSAFQLGIFLLAAWRLCRPGRILPARAAAAGAVGALAVLWPGLQLAAGATVNRGETWMQALNWISFLAVFLLTAGLLREERERERFLRLLVAGGAVLAVISVVQDYGSPGRIFWLFPSGYSDNVMGPFVNRNQYAAWVELLLPAALYLAARPRADFRTRRLFGLAAAILFGSVIASASRAGTALAMVELVAVGLVLARQREVPLRALAIRALQFTLLCGLAVAILGWQDLYARFTHVDSEILRADGVRASLAMIRERPWLGTGLGTWPIVYPRHATVDTGLVLNQAHNDWLQWTAEGGLPFLAILLIFTALIGGSAYRSVYALGIAAFLLHALVDYPMQQRPALGAWFFAMAGAACAYPGPHSHRPRRATRTNTTSCA